MHLTRRVSILACLAALAALAPAATAGAKPPPKGRYACTIGGTTLFGTLYIKGKKKYRYDAYDGKGKPGKFRSKGKKVKFRSGPLKKHKGYWWISSTKNRVITINNPKRGDFQEYSIECIREGKA